MLDQISILSATNDRTQKLCFEKSKNTITIKNYKTINNYKNTPPKHTTHFYLDRIVELLTMDWIAEIISFSEQVLGKHSPSRNDNEVATGWKNKET
jgi:hypothetical protein